MPSMRQLTRLVLLMACLAAAGSSHGAGGPSLELLQVLEIPADSASVRLQYGHPVARNGVQEQDAFCVFELDTVAVHRQRIEPERFAVTRVSRSVETFAGMPASVFPAVFGMDDELPSQLYYKTSLRLRSERQPTVRSLTCMSNQMMPGTYLAMRHLTLAEIRAALGAYFRLEPAVGF